MEHFGKPKKLEQIGDYLDLARWEARLQSDSKLAIELGMAPASLHRVRHGWGNLSDESMRRLAGLCGVPEQQAVADLNIWRSKTPETRSLYEGIKKTLQQAGWAAALLFAAFFASPAQAGTHPEQLTVVDRTLYIMRTNVY